jgi:hypothetical protein
MLHWLVWPQPGQIPAGTGMGAVMVPMLESATECRPTKDKRHPQVPLI